MMFILSNNVFYLFFRIAAQSVSIVLSLSEKQKRLFFENLFTEEEHVNFSLKYFNNVFLDHEIDSGYYCSFIFYLNV